MKCPGFDHANHQEAEFCEMDILCSPVEPVDLPNNDFCAITDKPVNRHHFRGIFPGLGGFRLEYFP
jgi:hypothetical protein